MRRALLLLPPLVALGLGCGRGAPADPQTVRLGRQVYGEEGCAGCHGADLRGAAMAPPLTRLSRNWDAAALERFLVAPEEVIAASPRLRRMDARYPADMPGMFSRDSARLRALVAFLLEH